MHKQLKNQDGTTEPCFISIFHLQNIDPMINDDTWLQDAIAENNCLLQNESTFKPFAVTINKNGVQESMNITLSMAKGDHNSWS